MMKVTLGLVLLAVVWVSASPHKNSGENSGEDCAATDTNCICHELLEPTTRPNKSTMKTIMTTCATQLGVTMPAKSGGGRGKRSSGHHMALSNEMRNCVELAIMKNANLLDAAGKISSTAVTTYYTTLLNANKAEVPTVTAAQIQKIVDGVAACVTQSSTATLPANTFQECMKTTCTTAVKA